jgi:hypothetical protein
MTQCNTHNHAVQDDDHPQPDIPNDVTLPTNTT